MKKQDFIEYIIILSVIAGFIIYGLIDLFIKKDYEMIAYASIIFIIESILFSIIMCIVLGRKKIYNYSERGKSNG